MSVLRSYQRQALDAFWAALSPEVNRVAIEMATGLGKTITFAAAIDEWLSRYAQLSGPPYPKPPYRALVLVHTDELVRQAVEKIQVVTQGRWSIGVVKATRDETDADIVVASKATLDQPGRRERIQDVGLIVVDECHHAVAPSYVSILEHYGAMPSCDHRGRDEHGCWDCRNTGWLEPPIPVLGVSATLSRTDGRGLGQVWQDMPFSRSLLWGQRKGFLIPFVPYTITIPGLDARASDDVLDEQLADSIAPSAVVDAWMVKCVYAREDGKGPGSAPSTVLFAPLVASAQAFADAFNAAGVKAEVVHGKMPRAERQAVLDRYEAGTTTVVCNAMVLTEGWDSPRTMCVIVARPTRSVPLFVQMIGRGARPWLDSVAPPREEQRCVLLCVQGTTTELSAAADLSENAGDTREPAAGVTMDDVWDLYGDVQDETPAWTGPVRVEAWDAAVQASSKAWQYTAGGVPFLPTAKKGQGYVFIVHVDDHWSVWSRRLELATGRYVVSPAALAAAPDLELAMAVAEDVAQDLGGDIGALLADKTRAWRKGTPSVELLSLARSVGVPEREIWRILTQRAAGKAGKLSDRVSIVQASKVLDRVADKIKERGSRA